MKIKYSTTGGHLDTFLFRLIGKRFKHEITEDKAIRGEVEIVRGVTASFFSANFISNDKGVFYKKGGQLHRTFLYLPRYYVKKYKRYPARHLFNCETVLKYGSFSISNQDNIDITCRDTGMLHTNINLITCNNCKWIFSQKVGKELYGQDFNEVILDFEESDETKNTQTGRGGYVTNWNEISTAFRESKNYQCEGCNYKMTERSGYYLMHVHHIDYDKTNNRRSNLQCLCIECHANVDDIHKRNFSISYQQRQIQEFKEKYKKY
jgi:hypothetical protein